MSANGYPSDWNSRRKKIYQRDGYECQNCGVYGGTKGDAELHAHHVVPKSKGGTHDTTNLITICKGCHNAVHGKKSAPTKKSRKNDSSGTIQDILEFFSVFKKISEQRDLVSGMLAIPLEGLNDYSDNDTAKEATEFVKEMKESREALTKIRFQLENIKLDYDEVVKKADTQSKSELKNSIEKCAELLLKEIELQLQAVNISQEYIEIISVVSCPNCGAEQKDEDSFCGECGEEIPNVWSCSTCGKSIEDVGQDFCKSCGEMVKTFPEQQNVKIKSLKNEADEITGPLEDSIQNTDAELQNLHQLAL
jgi:hypothetical protein